MAARYGRSHDDSLAPRDRGEPAGLLQAPGGRHDTALSAAYGTRRVWQAIGPLTANLGPYRARTLWYGRSAGNPPMRAGAWLR